MHPRIAAAVEDVRTNFADHDVAVDERPDGSVWLTIGDVDFGDGWVPRRGELGVKLTATFPDSAPYPWYLPKDMRRADGSPVDRISSVELDGAIRSQLSVNGPWSSNDSLAARFLGVLWWLRDLVEEKAS